MNIREKRALVANAYAGPSWKRRVENMNDDQIIAIYLEIMSRRKNEQPPLPEPTESEEQGRLF